MQFGDQWLTSGKSTLMCLPSVIVPEDTNVLINPVHADARLIRARVERQLLYDRECFDSNEPYLWDRC